ncbi:hypothetical protein LINPERHAP2_LOCUS12598, partial [Linum perenne]
WRLYFQLEDSPITTLKVWVRLPGIPLEYYDGAVLKIIGDKIGKTIRFDHTTLERSRGNFARICVEVDLPRPLLSKYHLRRRIHRIEYKGLHMIFYACGCYGHAQGACPSKTEDAAVVENLVNNLVFQSSAFAEMRPEVKQDFGPWMKVSRSGKKGKKITPTSSVSPADQPLKVDPILGKNFNLCWKKIFRRLMLAILVGR